jgi:hypothetical protein
MSTIIESLERRQLRDVPDFKAGDTVRVHFKVIPLARSAELSLLSVPAAARAAELPASSPGAGAFSKVLVLP